MTSAAFVAALKPLLEARPGLAGVAVHLTEPNPDELRTPAIVIVRGKVNHDVDWLAMSRRDDSVTVPGRVLTTGELQTAADEMEAIVTEIAQQLYDAPPQVGAKTLNATVDRIAWEPVAAAQGGYIVDAEFDITYRSEEVL